MPVHCWKDKREHMAEQFGFGSPEWADTFTSNGTCMLFQDHEGEHEFIPDSDITITFAPPLFGAEAEATG